jgi:hypothetical protein
MKSTNWLLRSWIMIAGLAFMLLLADLARTDAERQLGFTDMGGGLAARADGSVFDVWSLPGAAEVTPWDTFAVALPMLRPFERQQRWDGASPSQGLAW